MGEQRERRLVFGEDPEAYDRARPSYPEELIDDLVAWVGADARVIDVGTGTAKGTRLLAARGMTGVGVEPDPAMAAVAERHLVDFPGWRIDVADFELWPPQDGDAPADLVSASQSWHWVGREGPGKARDLLRPGGWIALWWNLTEDDRDPLRQAIEAVYAEDAPDTPFSPIIDRRAKAPFRNHPFEDVTRREYPWTASYSADELVDMLSTQSQHRLMAPDQRERLLDAVAQVVDDHGGRYDHHYVTQLWAGRRA